MQAKQLEKNEQAKNWFLELQNTICASLEKIEAECSSDELHVFKRTPWEYKDLDQDDKDGGGQMAVLRGNVFEKAGVNFSCVEGVFSPEFRKQIPGAENNGRFWASGVSLVIHPRNPLVPIVHMNTRMIVTEKAWFGGGADLTPCFEFAQDTSDFHDALKQSCQRHDATYYDRFKKWCDEYFYLPHRNEPRGIGGIFYDYLHYDDDATFDHLFAFTKDVGLTFNDIYPEIVRRHVNKEYGDAERQKQLIKRGRYAEFNLLYDRGTQFGLKTGGNTEAILMSLPPLAAWP